MSEDYSLCSICQKMMTDPVSTPCGHNFCKSCISTHWDTSVSYTCPVCKKEFTTRPPIAVNNLVSQMLMKRKYEAEQLFRPEDRFQLFQHVHSPLPATKDYTEVIVHLSSYEETALTVAAQMKDQIRDKLKMKRMKQFAVDVTFDPLTAYNKLNLSDDRKQVHMSDVKNNVPDNPERFYPCANVLGKQSFSSGKFYYEVLVEGKTDWTLGVVKKSIKRKGNVTLSPKNGCWIVVLREGNKYVACENPSIILHLKCVPKKVGVFVDYEGGVISFYDVGAAALIYSFTNCSFTYKLRPFFSPCLKNDNNAAPLIICPVSQSDEVL
uniref:Uncharacterized protein n=1 Tax=Gouania willdenowi TaxID=441366 RepID=A0A8C5ESQ9_GOUWI